MEFPTKLAETEQLMGSGTEIEPLKRIIGLTVRSRVANLASKYYFSSHFVF